MKGYDEWLWKQADRYYDNTPDDCREKSDYKDDCEKCRACLNRSREEYEEARAEAAYEEMKLHQFDECNRSASYERSDWHGSH